MLMLDVPKQDHALVYRGAEYRPQKYGAPNSSLDHLDHLVLLSSEMNISITN